MNLIDFINMQKKERYASFLIQSETLSGKSKYLIDFCLNNDYQYIDLLQCISEDTNIKKEIDIFYPNELRNYIYSKTNNKVVVINNIEFLLNIWNKKSISDFFSWVDKDDSRNVYIFIVNANIEINKEIILNNELGYSRIQKFDL